MLALADQVEVSRAVRDAERLLKDEMRFVGYRTETAPKGRELFVVFGLKFRPLADDRPISRMALSPQPLAHCDSGGRSGVIQAH